jgi:predicted Fe-Mo cluster-binding NifX family protein
MKIAFTAKGTDWKAEIDPRFGRTDYIVMYDDASKELSSVDNRAVEEVAHGAGPQTAQKLFDLEPDVLITGNGPGGNAATVLQKTKLKIFVGAGDMSVQAAYDAYKNGTLTAFA